MIGKGGAYRVRARRRPSCAIAPQRLDHDQRLVHALALHGQGDTDADEAPNADAAKPPLFFVMTTKPVSVWMMTEASECVDAE